LDKQCCEPNEDYKVSFVNENQLVDDWIGFFPASESNDDLRNYKIWLCTCGNNNVRSALPPGRWKVVLAPEGDEPYDAYAISDAFEVREVCEGEDETVNSTGDSDNEMRTRLLLPL
jgi:hypothetical protein